MIRTIYRHPTGTLITELSTEQLQNAARDRRGMLWIDLQSPTEEEYQLVLRDLFPFHPLAVEDVTTDVHVPKLDNYGSYLFIVFHTVSLGDERMDLHTDEVDAFLGANYLITIHATSRKSIDQLWGADEARNAGLQRGPAHLLYELLDRQVDSYIPLLDLFEARLEELGDKIFHTKQLDDQAILNDLLTAKSSALRLRRILLPQRDLLNRLASQDYSAVPSDERIYFRDVFDHVVRLADLAESTRDLAGMTIETYLALANNRMNEVMKVLTVIATIFMPLSFLAGVYGMNFDYMPELHSPLAYPFMWLLFLVIAGAMTWYFIRRRWL